MKIIDIVQVGEEQTYLKILQRAKHIFMKKQSEHNKKRQPFFGCLCKWYHQKMSSISKWLYIFAVPAKINCTSA